MAIESTLSEKFEKTLAYFHQELRAIRSGNISSELIEDLKVPAYESIMTLKEIATIQKPEARTLLIQPWDKSLVQSIEKALRQSEFHFNPSVSGDSIRISLPPLSEETRKDLIKIVGKKTEEGHVSVRHVRQDELEHIDRQEKNGDISEDDKFRQRDALQKLVEEYNAKIDELAAQKEKEILGT